MHATDCHAYRCLVLRIFLRCCCQPHVILLQAYIGLLLAAGLALAPIIRRFISLGLNRVWLHSGDTIYRFNSLQALAERYLGWFKAQTMFSNSDSRHLPVTLNHFCDYLCTSVNSTALVLNTNLLHSDVQCGAQFVRRLSQQMRVMACSLDTIVLFCSACSMTQQWLRCSRSAWISVSRCLLNGT